MRIINVHKLQLQFDDNGQPPKVQARDVIELINGVLAANSSLVGDAQLIAHPDEIEIEKAEIES